MKYSDKYPNHTPDDPDVELMFVSKDDGPCSTCGEPTNWISLSFECRFCSEECEEVFMRPLTILSRNEELDK